LKWEQRLPVKWKSPQGDLDFWWGWLFVAKGGRNLDGICLDFGHFISVCGPVHPTGQMQSVRRKQSIEVSCLSHYHCECRLLFAGKSGGISGGKSAEKPGPKPPNQRIAEFDETSDGTRTTKNQKKKRERKWQTIAAKRLSLLANVVWPQIVLANFASPAAVSLGAFSSISIANVRHITPRH